MNAESSHATYLSLIDQELDEVITQADRQVLAAHLSICADCRAAKASLIATERLLRKQLLTQAEAYSPSAANAAEIIDTVAEQHRSATLNRLLAYTFAVLVLFTAAFWAVSQPGSLTRLSSIFLPPHLAAQTAAAGTPTASPELANLKVITAQNVKDLQELQVIGIPGGSKLVELPDGKIALTAGYITTLFDIEKKTYMQMIHQTPGNLVTEMTSDWKYLVKTNLDSGEVYAIPLDTLDQTPIPIIKDTLAGLPAYNLITQTIGVALPAKAGEFTLPNGTGAMTAVRYFSLKHTKEFKPEQYYFAYSQIVLIGQGDYALGTGLDNEVKLFRVRDGSVLYEYKPEGFKYALSNDENWLYYTINGTGFIRPIGWMGESTKVLSEPDFDARFSPDNKYLLLFRNNDNNAHLYSVKSSKVVQTFLASGVMDALVTIDNQYAVFLTTSGVKVFSIASGVEVASFAPVFDTIIDLKYRPNQRSDANEIFALNSKRYFRNLYRIGPAGETNLAVQANPHTTDFQFSPDGVFIAARDKTGIQLFRIARSENIIESGYRNILLDAFTFLPDNTLVFNSNGMIQAAYSEESPWSPIASIDPPPSRILDMTSDCDKILYATDAGKLFATTLEGKPLSSISFDHQKDDQAYSLSVDCPNVYLVDQNTLTRFNLEQPARQPIIYHLGTEFGNSAANKPGHLLALSAKEYGTLHFFDTRAQKFLPSKLNLGLPATSMDFSADGTRLAVATADGLIHIYGIP